MFLEHQISIVELILRDHFTLKSGILAGENSALLLQEYFTFYNTFKQKTAILNCDNIVLFLLFDQVNAALVSTSKVPFKESLFTRQPYLQHLRAAHPRPSPI